MATQQATDSVIKIKPTIITPEFDFGPSDSVAANSVLLTQQYLRQLGAYAPRVGRDWDCHLWYYLVIDGDETAQALTDMTVSGTYWDPIKRVANTLTTAKGAGTGQITISFAATDSLIAGLYRFAITAVETETFEVCSGWLEIASEVPS